MIIHTIYIGCTNVSLFEVFPQLVDKFVGNFMHKTIIIDITAFFDFSLWKTLCLLWTNHVFACGKRKNELFYLFR